MKKITKTTVTFSQILSLMDIQKKIILLSLKTIVMATLSEDLVKYQNELTTTADIKNGIFLIVKIAGEVSGFIGVGLLTLKLVTLLSGALTPLGLAIAPAAISKLVICATRNYANLNTDERKQIRAVVKWLKTFGLG